MKTTDEKEQAVLPLMTAAEFASVCGRIMERLKIRTAQARKKCIQEGSDDQLPSTDRFYKAAQDYYVFTRLVEMCRILEEENVALKQILLVPQDQELKN